MELRDLEIFLRLSENLHFSTTAKEFFISPSSLTRIIQGLEEEMGVALFERDNRTVYLTKEGHRFKKTARDILNSHSDFFRKAEGVQLTGRLHLFCSVTASYSILPQYLKAFHKKNPLVDIDLETGSVENAVSKVQREEADLAIAILGDNVAGGIESKSITKIPLIFVGPTSIADEKNLFRKEAKVPFVLPPSGPVRDKALNWLSQESSTTQSLAQASSYEAVLSLVSSGVGVSVVPERVLQLSSLKQDITVLSSLGVLSEINIGLVCLKKSRYQPLVSEFWDCV